MAQKRTSADTSINSSKMPAIYSKFGIKGNILDYGCGKHTDHIKEAVNAKGFQWFGFDPYNHADLYDLMIGSVEADYIFCSNVLNVIDDMEELKTICDTLIEFCTSNHKTVVITVYEGNKSGIGRETKKDCWQRNERLHNYLQFFGNHGQYKTEVKKNCIILTPIAC